MCPDRPGPDQPPTPNSSRAGPTDPKEGTDKDLCDHSFRLSQDRVQYSEIPWSRIIPSKSPS
jgi:hypothetical protein